MPFSGQLTEKLLKDIALESPAMRVSITGFPKIAHVGDGHIDLTAQFAGVLVTASRALEWDGVAARTMQAVMSGMHWQNWGTNAGRAPFLHSRIEGLRSDNLFGEMTVKAGVSLWGFSWQQEARLQAVSNIVDGPGELFVKPCPPTARPADRRPTTATRTSKSLICGPEDRAAPYLRRPAA